MGVLRLQTSLFAYCSDEDKQADLLESDLVKRRRERALCLIQCPLVKTMISHKNFALLPPNLKHVPDQGIYLRSDVGMANVTPA